ncbi:BgTH12-07446 [Blumeria graminis f. sp. triticale]|uniref:BgTH12-07446 n=1 Tax=Blumeria graminis f. sp. triticale TaxID=1689686 RepID=A0A9W4CXF1_BLUGR|nr:BgTH12-07446 [Blumeria graminis f. sp. triticale]
MHCLIAVLLLTKPSWHTSDRLILIGYTSRNNYFVYPAPSDQQFPGTAENSGIFMTESKINGAGTYMRYYCSYLTHLGDMVAGIVGEQFPMPYSDITQSKNNPITHERCREYLDSLIQISQSTRMSDIIKNSACKASDIASLAFAGKISIGGVNRGFAPPENTSLFEVIADKQVKLSDLVLADQSVILNGSHRSTALVWYQGYLHKLNKCGFNTWSFETEFNGDNGVELFTYLRQLNEKFGEPSKLLMDKELNRSQRPTIPKDNAYQAAEIRYNDVHIHYQKVNVIKGRLPVGPITGFVDGR